MEYIDTKQKNLWMEGNNLIFDKKYKKAEKLLLKALKTRDDHPIYRHLTYNALIELYYKLRDEREDALDKCIFFCKKDIEFLPSSLKAFEDDDGLIPRYPSLTRLAIIYEQQGKYEEAISICELALKNGLVDSTKSGFSGRIEKLKKKSI